MNVTVKKTLAEDRFCGSNRMATNMSSREKSHVPFPSLIVSIYLPSLLLSIGTGATIPFLPLFARELGANLGLTGFIVSLGGIGVLAFDIPGGLLISKFGDYKVMFISAFLTGLVAFLTGLSGALVVLGALIFFGGALNSLWLLARLTYLRYLIPINMRGRSLSLIGGCVRIGLFLGPIAGGYIAKFYSFRYIFFFQAIISVVAFAIFISKAKPILPGQNRVITAGLKGLSQTFIRKRKIFATAGTGMFVLSLLRTARSIIIPLWGKQIGLDVEEIGIVFGFSSAIDMVMFIPAGFVMDRFGRRSSALICTTGIAIGFLLIPLTTGFGSFLTVCLIIGLTNGMGSGINMTIGTDFAHDDAPEKFVSIWRLISDIGSSVGPNGIGIMAQVLSLSASAFFTGVVGGIGAFFILFTLPETLQRHSQNAGAKK